jgi:hypothetical protein
VTKDEEEEGMARKIYLMAKEFYEHELSVEALQSVLDEIPDGVKPEFAMSGGGEDGAYVLEIGYWRDETPVEEAKRVADDARRMELIRREREESERATLAMLTKKYGVKICEDCPPVGYSTDETRCLPCQRRKP